MLSLENIKKKMSKWGGWFFYLRGFIPVPFFIFLIFVDWKPYENNLLTWLGGLLFLIMGEVLRCWGIHFIGKYSRTRKRKCKRLISIGPYALTRNPLYIGNFLIMVGFIFLSKLIWLLPFLLPFFFFYYTCIIFWEEEVLMETFPLEAKEYFTKVPRWFGIQGLKERLKNALSSKGDTSFRELIRFEKRTLQFLTVMILLMLMKELFSSNHSFLWIPLVFN